MTLPETIERWAHRHFSSAHAETVASDLIDAMTGNREPNGWERSAIDRIRAEREDLR